MGWEAVERNLNCEACGRPHFGDGEWGKNAAQGQGRDESRELCLGWKRLRVRFENVRVEDLGGGELDGLRAEVRVFWERYLEGAGGTGCDVQSVFALAYA